MNPRPLSPLRPSTLRRLENAARAAARQSYSPYSKFCVGAAVLTESGKIYAGANVENASYGLCNCAERSAIFAAAGAGARRIRAVVVHTPTRVPTAPCGACRQVINEFGPDALVISMGVEAARVEPQRIALTWDRIDLDSLARLKRVIELNAAAPALLNRELAGLG